MYYVCNIISIVAALAPQRRINASTLPFNGVTKKGMQYIRTKNKSEVSWGSDVVIINPHNDA
jgi:hypothetical protein